MQLKDVFLSKILFYIKNIRYFSVLTYCVLAFRINNNIHNLFKKIKKQWALLSQKTLYLHSQNRK